MKKVKFFYVAVGKNACVITDSFHRACELQDKYFINPRPPKKYADFEAASDAAYDYLCDLLPYYISPPDTFNVNQIVFTKHLWADYRNSNN